MNLNLLNEESHAQPTQHFGHLTVMEINVVYIINCVWAVVSQECMVKFWQESCKPWHSKRRRRQTARVKTF